MLLSNLSAVITGAGSGVGRATAIMYAEQGAMVMCSDIEPSAAESTCRDIERRGGIAVAARCDVSVEAEVTSVIADAVTKFGRLDVMFNNAGIATPRRGMRFEEHTVDDYYRLSDVNFKGVFLGMKQAILQFREQGAGGVIINTASVGGLVAFGGPLYGATKGAVVQLTRTVAVEVAPIGIRVNSICPAGMPDTNFGVSARLEQSELEQAAERELIASMHPTGRVITPDDCAHAAVFLASAGARNITGVNLPLDGGLTAR
jgi:NAD(P)-dependent dehydrogenase (short-subunit alcohol dehydrogenase family)